jgi:hypothetical protein
MNHYAMKDFHIAYAGCPPDFVKRLNLAIGLLPGEKHKIQVKPWRGDEAQLLIADEGHAFAKNVAKLASQNNIPVLFAAQKKCPQFDNCGGCVSYAEPINSLSKKLANYFMESHYNHTIVVTSGANNSLEKLLAQQAAVLTVSTQEKHLILDYQRGLCLADSQATIDTIVADIAADQPVTVTAETRQVRSTDQLQTSIEQAFFSPLLETKQLPSFNANIAVQLRYWPNMLASENGLTLAQCCRDLTRGANSRAELVAHYGQENLINALLWSTKIARLHIPPATPAKQKNRPASTKVSATLAKLIRWLGR